MQTLLDALRSPYPCSCACRDSLSDDERAAAVAALYRIDDALRGWGYTPVYDLAANPLFLAAQQANDPTFRDIVMRDDACVYRRLVGFGTHEVIHALEGDPSKANYGIPWSAPYSVPLELPEGDEAAYLEPFNVGEARAFVGLEPVAKALFDIDFAVYSARDFGTYGFVGGNAIVPAPRGCRQVPHWDRQHHPREYRERARALETRERTYFTPERLEDYRARFTAAEAKGFALRQGKYPAPVELARLRPRLPGRNDLCLCGSGQKFKKCHGASP